jgi:hypothetical protein
MAFLDIFKKKEKENVGGMEDFMTLIRVYFQSVLASNLGISNINALPDLLTFKRTLHVATVNNRLGIGEKKACAKMLKDIYGISDSFFKEIDLSIKKGCKNQNDVSRYLFLFQGFSQDLMMLMGNLLKWKFRIPGFMKKMMKKVTDNTVHEVLTKDSWSDGSVVKTVHSVRRYQQMLGFSEAWIQEYVYNLITLAKKEPNPSEEEVAKAQAKIKK